MFQLSAVLDLGVLSTEHLGPELGIVLHEERQRLVRVLLFGSESY